MTESGAVDDGEATAGHADTTDATDTTDTTDATDLTDIYREYGDDRLPPGQRETDRFPVLSKSGTPSADADSFAFEVWGAVDERLSYSLSEFRDLPAVTQRQDFHCVTGWSKFDCAFTGVEFTEIADRAGVDDDVTHVLFHALDGYTTNLTLDECARDGVLFAYGYDGEDLPADHGGPIRVVTPHKYAYKGAKWVSGVEFLTNKELGYWEKRGYSDTANPWNEERYS
ncbi:oxidoreductase molybdopterin binding protein [Halorubrum aidingense JCM 13560]|uniref:Oxidoreductase molybdopterin binding protein n=1 Tax=Halorubrum aidingense JCM 13560 TaxID=1230454 RepID=M0PDN7_9EURY|nr:sulfite oxidase-like oxidoreductase [Halorubrum aidingense]EMA68252.1 oxidoreductase molybdopterin binding protein [Halorubrum aidingense JCM 13560]